MHGCCSGSTFLVNAEVDSMGGVVDGVIGVVGNKPSPRRAAIEKAQAELRQEYDVRDERIRELEFLEKGGDPLDFKLGPTASVSVQSTSLTDQHPQIFTSEAKGSFPLIASPRGDSAESSGRPGGAIACEANSADNLLLFDGDNELPEGERLSKIPCIRSNATLSQQSFDPVRKAKEVEDSAIFRPYARRNRTRSNRDGARSTSNDVNSSRSSQVSLPACHGLTLGDEKGSVSETNIQKDQQIIPIANTKGAAMNGDAVCNVDDRLSTEMNGMAVREDSTASVKDGLQEGHSPLIPSAGLPNLQQKQAPEVDVKQFTTHPFSWDSDIVKKNELVVSAGVECIPSATAGEIAIETIANEDNHNGERNISESEDESGHVAVSKKINLESAITLRIPSLSGNSDKDLPTDSGDMDHNGNSMEHTLVSGVMQDIAGGDILKMNELKSDVRGPSVLGDDSSAHLNNKSSVSEVKVEKDINESSLQKEANVNVVGAKSNDVDESKTDQKEVAIVGDTLSFGKGDFSTARVQVTRETYVEEIPDARISRKDCTDLPDLQSCHNQLKESKKEREDSVLAEARIIEAKRKRISELSVATFSFESHRKSHWDFVLEEMSWLANDFAQERIWKITMGAHISRKVAAASRLRLQDQLPLRNQQKLACTLAEAVMKFWHSAELLLDRDAPEYHKHDAVNSERVNDPEGAGGRIGQLKMEASKDLKLQHKTQKIEEYAVRFLEYNRTRVPFGEVKTSLTPETLPDLIFQDLLWVDHLTEENLFYTVAAGAMESYRRSIESYLKTGSNMQEEVDTSMHDAFEELSQENAYDEDVGETRTYYLPGAFEGSKASKFAQNKNIRSYASRPYDNVADSAYGQYGMGSQQSGLMRKRPTSNLNVVSIPTKRMRTAPRPRMLSPFGTGVNGNAQASFKTDASSGETNSLQDDQSTLNGGSQVQNSMEVDSTLEFDKQFPYDSGEISAKPKKRKKAKHLNSTYDQRWQLGSTVPHEQRDQYKKRLESSHFESNGCNGVFGQHSVKKPKIMKQSLDVSFENMTPVNGPMPSPVASQMSNMSNSNKFLKMIGGRDRGKKTKGLKAPHGAQAGSGSAWSLFEDQALVVLVHDLGTNWELISDAINSTRQFTCIFRKPRECRERHNILMDRTTGDGADSAEDSGSSQPYPSTLPGIPKGSARQLFQRLQGPVEEDTLKTHFERIILIGQKQHCRRTQLDNQDMKPIPAHKSHGDAVALVCPNNLDGAIQTPLDLCESTALSPDVLPLGYQGSQISGFPNQGSVQSMFSSSGSNPSLQGSAGLVLGNNLSSPPGPLNAPVRDGRYGVPRLPVDEQQRHNSMLSNRNIQQPNMVASGSLSGNERGSGRMVSGGNGIGMMSGMNSRGMPMSRPGFQGMTSSSMLNSANIFPTMGVPTPVNIAGSGQTNSMPRSRDAVTQMRPGQTPVVPEVTQGNNQAVPSFNGFNPNFSSQTGSTPGQMYPVHPQHQHHVPPQQSHMLSNSHHPHLQGPNHAMAPQRPAYTHRHVKERQLQHQRMLQQQQHFSASNGLMPQPSSSLQSSSLNQSQSSQAAVLSPSSPTSVPSQVLQKHHLAGHGLSRNHQLGLANQIVKQRQRPQQQQQPLQQSGRPSHPQQRQMLQSQQPGKLVKGNGRGNTLMHSNISVDPAHLNGVSVTPLAGQATGKGDQVMPLTQGQSLYSGSNLNTVTPASQSSSQVQIQSKHLSSPPLAKQLQPVNSLSNNNSQGQVPSVPTSHASTASHHQMVLPLPKNSNHQLPLQSQLQQNQVDQTQVNIQKSLQQNRSVTQAEQSKLDQDDVNSSPPKNATLSTSVEPTNQAPAMSSLGTTRWKGPESLSGSGGQNPHSSLSTVGSSHPTASGGDSVQLMGRGEVQEQLSGSLPSHGSGQWQQHTHVKQSEFPLGTHQQQLESPKKQQSIQQIQHQQVGKNNMYIGPTNS